MEVKISGFRYLDVVGTFARPAPVEAGIILGEKPRDFKSYYFCVCGREVYDGGLCSAVLCTCGEWVKRDENEAFSVLQGEPLENKCKSKGFAEAVNLVSVNFGVFDGQTCIKYKKYRGLDYKRILESVLREFFIKRLRCVEENLIFFCRGIRFKVLACQPSQGFVVSSTRLHLNTKLSEDPIKELEIVPLFPYSIQEEIFESVFLPYFTKEERHIHPGEHIIIYGLECVVTKTKPKDGFVVPELTEFTYSELPLPYIEKLEILPYIDDLPPYFQSLSSQQFINNILNFYLMPYFLGWRRIAKLDQIIEISLIDFKITQCEPYEGVITDSTLIVYNGNSVSRRRNPEMLIEIQEFRDLVLNMELEMQIREAKSKDLPDFVMDHLPSETDQKNCVICLSEFEVGDKIKLFPCCHIFHKVCSEKWLRRNLVCPVCKNSIKD